MLTNRTTILPQATKALGLVGAASLTVFSLLAGSATSASAQLGSISGIKFNDLNKNGVRDALELGLPGWEIELLNFEGNVIASTTTNLFGTYRFNNLPAGPYVVREVLKPGWKQTLPTFQKSLQLGQVLGPWDYSDPDSQWPLIAPDASGNFQSPVNITETPSTDLSKFLSIHYSGLDAETIKNTGYAFDVEYHPGNANFINVAGERFDLLQFHFHYESEHAIDNVLSDMEVHFVNRHAHGGLSVLGLLIEEGDTNQTLAPVFDEIAAQLAANNGAFPSTVPFTDVLDLESLFPSDWKGWFYNGSLTTPPATEGVNWFVFETPIEMSAAQIDIFQDFLASNNLTNNNRPLQDLNGRQFNEHNHQETISGGSISGLNFGNALDLGLLGLLQFNYQVTVNGDDVGDLNFGNTAVPEPMTILGVGMAFGFGAGFKRKMNKKQKD
ncbi:Carbonate dehydratase [Gloeothece citriformis PCC 7424]|uniref:carbonic anhydrase n=1 Tax=Gloeothece citriformis (strain PCC 7424) TaxID=65393 RepID=B7KGJ9_GLOC7|nr:PEP-CTERM sorting domain-containing protein [Gloeothece citriformis]ACK71926.1 Carbonate dehydratase [Gloeothece citriformis PCC 7424]